jgi:hypothetical protein
MLFLDLVGTAVRRQCGERPFALREIELHQPFLVSEEPGTLARVELSPTVNGSRSFRVYGGRTGRDTWLLHASGVVVEQ